MSNPSIPSAQGAQVAWFPRITLGNQAAGANRAPEYLFGAHVARFIFILMNTLHHKTVIKWFK